MTTSFVHLLKDLIERKALLAIKGQAECCVTVGVEVPAGVVGINVEAGDPSPREGGSEMAKTNVRLVKKSQQQGGQGGQGAPGAGRAARHRAGDPVNGFIFQDNEDSTCTVNGIDAAGQPVDISGAATLSVTSSDTSVLVVDAPSGMTFTMHGQKPGHSDVNVTATWNDGSLGPFNFLLPVDCSAGPAGGIVVTPGTPTPR